MVLESTCSDSRFRRKNRVSKYAQSPELSAKMCQILPVLFGVKCSNLTNAARGARSLVGKYHPYFDLLARSLTNLILILTCSLAHSENMIGMFLARSLIGKYRHYFDLLARSFRTDEICTLIMLAHSLIG